MNFRICCLLSLCLLVITGTAGAVAPTVPTNFSMPKFTYYNSTVQFWRMQWTDTSTDEDGFQIYFRIGGSGGGQPVYLYRTIPTGTSLTSVATTSGSTTVTCASTATLGAGWSVTGPNVPSGATVASVTNATTFVLSAAATGTASGQTLSAASIYKAANGYTYAVNMDISQYPGLIQGGYAIDWWVSSYNGTPPSSYTNLSNTASFSSWQGYNITPTLTAPSGLTVTPSGDGQFHVAYNDNSNNEQAFQLEYKLPASSTWTVLAYPDFGVNAGSTTGASSIDVGGYLNRTSDSDMFLPVFQPGTAYDFRIRALDWGSGASDYTSTVTASTQAFKPPTSLVAVRNGENTVDLTFSNNSTVESGYHFQYRVVGSGTWLEPTSNTGANIGYIDNPSFNSVNSSYFVALNPKTNYEFQVRAYIRGVNNTTTAPTQVTTFSTPASATTIFNAPSGLTATTVSEGAVNLAWVDNSAVEGGFGIYARIGSSGNFTLLDYIATNVTTYAVTGLSPGIAYDFQVTAAYGTTAGNIESTPSNTATATTKDGFTSLTYTPITYNQAFSYPLTVSTASARSSWNITGLPAGLTFDSSTGIISGTPTVTGVFACPTTATFANGWITNSTLTLRVVRAAAIPVTATTIPGQTLANGGNTSISLTDKFADLDSESAVRVETNIGTMDFILYSTATPATVANFLSYANNPSTTGNYNGAVFHRSVPDFIVQGGAFKVLSDPDSFTSIITTASPINEPGISNLRGTVAMAKVGSDPNSATDQFFVNLADNSANLDLQNGGFTAFGRVAGNGMTVADAMAALPVVNATVNVDGNPTTSLTNWPLQTASATMDTTQVVSITSVAPVAVLSYTVTGNTNPTAVSATINGSDLLISGTAGGQSDVTVTATDLDGNPVTQTFSVLVNQAAVFTGTAPTAGTVGVNYSFTYTTSGFPLPTFSHTSGTLPPGLTLSSAGVLSGTPTTAGDYSGVVTATNTDGSDTQSFSITVAKGTATIVLTGAQTQTYDGNPKVVTATTTPPGLTVDITYGDPASPTAPSDFGSYAVSATINDANYSGTQTGTLTIVGQSADNWRTQHFTTEQVTAGLDADNADPDGDGITNLEEYARGTDPNTRTPPLSPTHDVNGLTLTFTRPKGLPNVTYAAESTDTLTSWDSLTLEVIIDGPVQTIRVRDPLATGNPNRRFIHLIFGTTPTP